MNEFSPNLLCALIWKSGLGLLMDTFCQFLRVNCPKYIRIFIHFQKNGMYYVTGYGVRPSVNFFVSG